MTHYTIHTDMGLSMSLVHCMPGSIVQYNFFMQLRSLIFVFLFAGLFTFTTQTSLLVFSSLVCPLVLN